MRTIVDIPEHQLAALGELCERERISRAEAVRRALEAMLALEQPRNREKSFGKWSQQGDSHGMVRKLREEWSR